ncbi:MAG: T9SS type A sorting domain-containing protein [bacterium]
MKAVFDYYGEQVAPLAYHVWWPSSMDSFYNHNPADVYTRTVFYHPYSAYVPAFRFDGRYLGDPGTTTEAKAIIDSLLQIPSPIRINLDQYWSLDMDSVYVSFDIVCVDPVRDPVWLQFAVGEAAHYYPLPGYPTVPKRWYHAMRDMVPDANGTQLSLSPGDSLHYDWIYPIPDIFAQDDAQLVDDQWDMTTVIFVQDTSLVVYFDSLGAPIDTVIEGGEVYQAIGERVRDVSGVRTGTGTEELALSKNWPNPFKSQTSIAYALTKAGQVRLSVYSVDGRLVTRLVDTYSEPGAYSATWNGLDRFGERAGSGMYYYRLETAAGSRTGTMVLLK